MLVSLLVGVLEYDKLDVFNGLGVPIKEGVDVVWFGVPLVPDVLLVDSTNGILWYGSFSLFWASFKNSCLKKSKRNI
jgi:hypothetical protein